ncbi:DUF4082 domain-containing protein [Danxiaibacter flavus]|uniref:DUF4082 domain-containing protein n=1 Tax=Danxiaibacter flavus TaxID=3049108 RepID=A0ABV3ZKC5_9BACT|nr:DUF4082 domain-containing protein [Chitinophagaceae bacterium DXS]
MKTAKLFFQQKYFHSVRNLRLALNLCFRVISCIVVLFTAHAVNAQNAIVTENQLPGNPSAQWDIQGAGDLSIQGFATDISVNKGETVHFKIKTNASNYSIDIYRIGYYQGNGARKVGTGVITATLPQTQPNDLYDVATGLTDCGNWNESAHWDVPATAVSGIYIAKLTRADNNGSSHITFVVRDDASTSDLYFKTSDGTWQAYNNYGGNSLYENNSGTAVPGFNHATKVSYNRPFYTRNGGDAGEGGIAEDWVFNAEYPMIRWLEKNGFDVSYTSNVDADRRGDLIRNHKVFLSVGHDEYWSGQEVANVTAARNAGVHLAFFSGNEIYWKTRYEASTDGSATSYRTLVCYKEGTLGENVCGGKCDPLPNVWTGLWRAGCEYPNADGCKPENGLTGQISWKDYTGAITVPDTYKNLRFWRNTSIASLGAGQTATLSAGTLGYECDFEQYESYYPAGRIRLSSTAIGNDKHALSLYRHASGALVFGAGTVQWSWGLDGVHDRGGSVEDPRMQQATVNLFADMGVQPASLQSPLTIATMSTDLIAPSSVIATPAASALLPTGTAVVISGTAADDGGGVVAGVEISTDGGVTWQRADGTTNWSYSWTPTTTGSVTIHSRSFDDNGNIEAMGSESGANTVNVKVYNPSEPNCPCNVFQPTDVPAIAKDNDGTSIEIGFKFRSNTSGFITGVRYYKGAGTTGTHIGHLWSSSGASLAQITFNNETASGWQEAKFSTSVAITAGVTYVASIFSSSGDYANTNPYFTSTVTNGPLSALATNIDGPNGVYKYSPTPVFPTDFYQSTNYWVDVVFETQAGPDITPPDIAFTAPDNGSTKVNVSTAVTLTFDEPINTSSITASTFMLLDSSGAAVPANITYDNQANTATLKPIANLAYSKKYTVVAKGGSSNPAIKDLAGNALSADTSFSFTTQAVPPPPPTNGTGGPILIVSDPTNPFSRYTVEILRAEGLNEFNAMDISQVTTSVLNSYDVVVLGEMSISSAQATMFSDWTNAGGTLIAFRPNAQLSALLGITQTGSTLSDKYIKVDTSTISTRGIVSQTIQYHGTADLYNLNGATSLATLFSDANTATTYPAVTIKTAGTGTAVAFTYDLAKSVIYTRQGNPAWAGQKRDGQIDPIRSDDQFFPDWIDFSKIAIPQADEQQHLLANLIIKNSLKRKPLPRLWFLPKGFKAAVVMTGDDHGDAGMQPRFDINISESPTACSVKDWECIRSTGYLYVGSTFTNALAKHYDSLGFEVALHVNTNCGNVTATQYQSFITDQMSAFSSTLPGVPTPSTNRNHCITWSNWSTVPEVEVANGIRLDANYYYWPDAWIHGMSGMFTGSGVPMRFAKINGELIDCYQLTTQMPDESNLTFPNFIDTLLDKATGPEGYYGVFTANMHFDNPDHPGANAIVASAKAHSVPVVSAKQMLDWLDARNAVSYTNMSWNGSSLTFTLTAGADARNLQCMIPHASAAGMLSSITRNGAAVTYRTEVIKGINYAFFTATTGDYTANYGTADNSAPQITAVTATVSADSATIKWTTNEAASSKVNYAPAGQPLTNMVSDTALVTSHTMVINGLTFGTTYYYRVTSADKAANSSSSPVAPDSLTFNVPVPNSAPVITLQPQSKAACPGAVITFKSTATGTPAPTVQWQSSTTGTTWSNITGAKDTILTVTASTTINGTRYRAVWSNSAGSITSDSAKITVSTTVTVALSAKSAVTCNGGSNGTLTVTASGGTGPYQYKLGSTGTYQQSPTFMNLRAGSYTVYANDLGCGGTGSLVVTITQPTAVKVVLVSQTNLTCYGVATGSLTVSGTGGTGSIYTFRIGTTGTFQSSPTFSNLAAGSYKVYAQDSVGCISPTALTVTITQPAVVKAVLISKTNTSCNGGSDGTATVSGTGGTAPYQFRNGVSGTFQTSPTITGLPAGSAKIYAMDNVGCVSPSALSVSISQPAALKLSIASQTNVSCSGGSNGSVTVSATGQSGTYLYRLGTTGTFQASPIFTGLKAGTYTIYAQTTLCPTLASINVKITQSNTPCIAGARIGSGETSIRQSSAMDSVVASTSKFDASVSPNPSASDFSLVVKGTDDKEVTVTVSDILGRPVYSSKGVITGAIRFGENLQPGVYIVNIQQGKEVISLRIIKQ